MKEQLEEIKKRPKLRHKCDESGCRVFKPGNEPIGVPSSLRREKDGLDRLVDSMPVYRKASNMKNNNKLH
tara:strand:+ start:1396 stop:1605 length:210 start_codon:yes stop_codon:yes gene_type:complete